MITGPRTYDCGEGGGGTTIDRSVPCVRCKRSSSGKSRSVMAVSREMRAVATGRDIDGNRVVFRPGREPNRRYRHKREHMSRYPNLNHASPRTGGWHRLLPGLALLLAASRLPAQPVSTPHVDAELVCETVSVQPGKPFHVALRLVMEDGWHTYWRNPGDAGMPTSIEWRLPEGWSAGEVEWPVPERLGEAPEVSYGYGGTLLLPVEIIPPAELKPAETYTIAASASWLVCNEVCIPGKADLALRLPAVSTPAGRESEWGTPITIARGRVPVPLQGWSASALRSGEGFILRLVPSDPSLSIPSSAAFFPGEEGMIDHSAAQETAQADGSLIIRLARSPYASAPVERLQGVLYTPSAWDREKGIQAMEIDLPVENAE